MNIRDKAEDIVREHLGRELCWSIYSKDEYPDEALKMAEAILWELHFVVPHVRARSLDKELQRYV